MTVSGEFTREVSDELFGAAVCRRRDGQPWWCDDSDPHGSSVISVTPRGASGAAMPSVAPSWPSLPPVPPQAWIPRCQSTPNDRRLERGRYCQEVKRNRNSWG